jgi:hypothetical protein
MPKSLKVSPGERIDTVDLVHGANTYTAEMRKQMIERLLLDRRSRVIDGFRIQIPDQTLYPGQITVINGNALDRDGNFLNNESSANDARTVTVTGLNTTFYVEVEFVETASDVDSRFFWDPTAANTAPEPDGQEFSLNVATRNTPDWRIVSPVSTTGFQQSTSPDSIRVPLVALRTDGSNRILTGGTNPGLTQVRAASVLEQDTASGSFTLRIVDARPFPGTTPFTIEVDSGAGTAETRTVTAVNRDEGILTISVATTNDHDAGAIIRVTSGNAELVREKTDPSDPDQETTTSTPEHPDMAQRLWQADETRGSGLISSKETYGSRDDLNVRTLKDHIDYLSAQLRELKFGSPRPDTVSAAPPTTFATRPRYFDPAGGVAGARTATISIGNGTTTFGDFNGTTETVFTEALAALPSAGGIIFVKAGTYVISSAISVTKQVKFVGAGTNATFINSAGDNTIFTVGSAAFNVELLSIVKTSAGTAPVIDVTASTSIGFNVAILTGAIRVTSGTAAIRGYRLGHTSIDASATMPLYYTNGGTLNTVLMVHCTLQNTTQLCGLFRGTVSNFVVESSTVLAIYAMYLFDSSAFTNIRFSKCSITTVSNVLVSSASTTGTISDVTVSDCYITLSSGFAPYTSNVAVFNLNTTTAVSNLWIKDNYFITATHTGTAVATPGALLYVTTSSTVRDVHAEGNILSAPSGSAVHGVVLSGELQGTISVQGNTFDNFNCVFRTLSTTTGSTPNVLVRNNFCDNNSRNTEYYGVRIDGTGYGVVIEGNYLLGAQNASIASARGVWIEDILAEDVIISNNRIFDLGTSNASVADGIMLEGGTTNALIQGNSIVDLTGSSTIAGISVTGVSRILNNTIRNLGSTTTCDQSIGIEIDGASSTVAGVVSGNHVSVVRGANSGGSTPSVGIYAYDCELPLMISNNYVEDCSCGGSPVAGRGGIGIMLDDENQLVSITDNVIYQSPFAGIAQHSIVLYSSNASVFQQDIQVTGNLIYTSASSSSGIAVIHTTNGTGAKNLNIANNVIRMNATALALQYGIYVSTRNASFGINIRGNTIRETTAGNLHHGIYAQGTSSGGNSEVLSIQGNILNGDKSGSATSGTRVGIDTEGFDLTSICNNVISWMEPASCAGTSIQIGALGAAAATQTLVSANLVRPDSDGGTFEVYLNTALHADALIIGNVVGYPAQAGVIQPAATVGNVTVTDNKLT